MKVAAMFLVLFMSITSFAQNRLAPQTNTSWNDYPVQAAELPGKRYAIGLLECEKEQNTPDNKVRGRIVILDSLGSLLHSLDLPADTVKLIQIQELLYTDGRLYLTYVFGGDSLGINIPRFAGVMILDTSLSLITQVVEDFLDSIWHVAYARSTLLNGRLYILYQQARKMQIGSYMGHPILVSYDLQGNFLARRELDTTFFPLIAGGNDYTIWPNELINNGEHLVISTMAGTQFSGGLFFNPYLLWVDTVNLNLSKAVSFGCVNNACTYDIQGAMVNGIFLDEKTMIMGATGTYYQRDRHLLAKYIMPDSSFTHASYLPQSYVTLQDTNGFLWPAVKSIDHNGNRLFYLGQSVSKMPFYYSSFKNHVFVSCVDTYLNLSWTKYVGGDAYYFPYSILATSDGGCLVLAYRYDSLNAPNNAYDHYIFKLDANGNLLSAKELPVARNVQVDVFPNPASDQLNISLPEAGEYQIRIYDMNGRMTHSHQFTGKQTTIDIRTSPLGTYTYQLWNNAGRVASGLWLKR